MIEAIIGSIIGTAITFGLVVGYMEYSAKKQYKKQKEDIQKLIEELTTFKIKLEDVI
jgi:virulence-associated protein VapD